MGKLFFIFLEYFFIALLQYIVIQYLTIVNFFSFFLIKTLFFDVFLVEIVIYFAKLNNILYLCKTK
jgi:hypothetical protein